MIYVAWNLAGAILNHFDNVVRGKHVIAIPVIAMFITVMWDVAMDPFMSTLSGNWKWHEGGAFFGVPIQNYYGWYLCVFTMFQLFAFYLSKRKKLQTPKFVYTKQNWLQLILIYSSWPITYILKGYFYPNVAITAANGQVWMTHDILKTAGLIGLSTMIFISVLVFIKVYVLEQIERPNEKLDSGSY
jgi:putative membrane protein